MRGLSHAEARALRAAKAGREAKPARTPDEVRERQREGGKKAGRGRKVVDNGNDLTGPKGGNQASYLAARIARDAPAIAERLASGEFRSVRAAALEAYSRKRADAGELYCRAGELRLRAERRIGELLGPAESLGGRGRRETVSERNGLTRLEAHRLRVLAQLNEAEFERRLAEAAQEGGFEVTTPVAPPGLPPGKGGGRFVHPLPGAGAYAPNARGRATAGGCAGASSRARAAGRRRQAGAR